MSSIIKHSVGAFGRNDPPDVIKIQHLLNRVLSSGAEPKKIKESGHCDSATVNAIFEFQKRIGATVIDGRVDKKGTTIRKLLSTTKNNSSSTSNITAFINSISIANLVRYLESNSVLKIEQDHQANSSVKELLGKEEFKLLIATIYTVKPPTLVKSHGKPSHL
ncbi:MAG: hypothetical protein HY080_13000 [Gammaproteobacteria bacterium]|nr:hypothetical protein [Gammaproteobacteria bacterium]